MILYKLENNELQEIQTHRFDLECDVQSLVENNCSNLLQLNLLSVNSDSISDTPGPDISVIAKSDFLN